MIMSLGTNVRVSVCANQGGREYMEDRVQIHCSRTATGHIDYIYLAVYDGHGGSEASDYVRGNLLNNITRQNRFKSHNDNDVLRAIRDGFIKTHRDMWRVVGKWRPYSSDYQSTSGTTASCVFIRNGKLYIGHVGDSGIVLGTRSQEDALVGSSLTVDHKPDSPTERRRIEETGGELIASRNTMRVAWTRTEKGHKGPVRRSTKLEKVPFLAIARSLGDLWSYNSFHNEFVVSPRPDVSVRELSANDVCLILGSDGLWNMVGAQEAVEIANNRSSKELEHIRQSDDHLMQRGAHCNHSLWLVKEALRRWKRQPADNVTVITVIFDSPNATSDNACVRCSDPRLNIENELTTEPEAMIHISQETTQLLRTRPVELSYIARVPGVEYRVMRENFHGPGYSPRGKRPSDTGSEDERSSTPKRTRSENKGYQYYCQEHGLDCAKAKRMNASIEP